MTELKYPNCGGKQFDELGGKRQCAPCGAEFEREQPKPRTRYKSAPHYHISRETVDVKPHAIKHYETGHWTTMERSKPGITAEEWHRRARSCEIDNFKVAIGNIFLPLFRLFMPSLRSIL